MTQVERKDFSEGSEPTAQQRVEMEKWYKEEVLSPLHLPVIRALKKLGRSDLADVPGTLPIKQTLDRVVYSLTEQLNTPRELVSFREGLPAIGQIVIYIFPEIRWAEIKKIYLGIVQKNQGFDCQILTSLIGQTSPGKIKPFDNSAEPLIVFHLDPKRRTIVPIRLSQPPQQKTSVDPQSEKIAA